MRKSSKGWGRESPHQQNGNKEVQYAAITRISPSAEQPQGSTAWGKYNNRLSCWTTTKSSKGESENLPTDGIFALFLLIDFFIDCLIVFCWSLVGSFMQIYALSRPDSKWREGPLQSSFQAWWPWCAGHHLNGRVCCCWCQVLCNQLQTIISIWLVVDAVSHFQLEAGFQQQKKQVSEWRQTLNFE